MDWAKLIRRMSPNAKPEIVAAIVDHIDQLTYYHLDTKLRSGHLFAHMSVETQGFTRLEENLNYTAERLVEVWPSHFGSVAAAESFAHNPKALAIKVYGARMGNVPGSEDGWTFRGQGGLDTTGRANVARLAMRLSISAEQAASWLIDPSHMFECACATFVLLDAEIAADHNDIEASTRAINGGLNGLKDREEALKKFNDAYDECLDHVSRVVATIATEASIVILPTAAPTAAAPVLIPLAAPKRNSNVAPFVRVIGAIALSLGITFYFQSPKPVVQPASAPIVTTAPLEAPKAPVVHLMPIDEFKNPPTRLVLNLSRMKGDLRYVAPRKVKRAPSPVFGADFARRARKLDAEIGHHKS
jgi:putative chitinase